MRIRYPLALATLALLLTASFVAHAAKTTRTARTVQFAKHISVTGFQPDPSGGWFLVLSFANEAEGQMSNTVIDPGKLCALPADDPASDQILMSNLHKPGKASRNKALGGMAWSWCYVRFGSIWPAYVSHAIVDVAVFAVGWDLLFN